MVSLFKDEETNHAIALAYLTGIMPIIKEKTQSKLNNFTEYTMIDSDEMASFMGFTEDEVKSLATQSDMEFGDLKKWYDGYNLNGKIGTDDRFLCVSRPRRFGKTMAANMIAAYYSKGCDSHEIFSDLKISKDPSYEENINKYAVIQLDMNDVMTNKGSLSVSEYLNRVVVAELRDEYQNIDLEDGITLSNSLKRINLLIHDQFVFVIDEYDVVIRDEEYSKDFNDYLKLLVSLFKSSSTASAIALAYLTRILPIIQDKTDSGLNNFTEYTMLDADEMAPFMGFTEDEVKSLSTQSGMEFDELKKWYDGYNLNEIEIYSPKSVINSVEKRRCDDYWTQTKSYKALKDYILLDFDGIKNDVISMISGEHIPVNVKKFTNTSFIDSKDDAFTSLIHLGYL